MNPRLLILMCIAILKVAGCSIFESDDYIINDGRGIRLHFDEGLNDDAAHRLPQDANGFFLYELNKEGQNVQRISVRLLQEGEVLHTPVSGYRHKLNWENNLYWWLMEGDTVASITRRYFNPYTGEYQYVNLPPLINWKDVLVPTINPSSITDDLTGRGSTVIAPIGEMRGDTMTVYVSYNHQITKQRKNSSHFELIGQKEIRDSVRIILR